MHLVPNQLSTGKIHQAIVLKRCACIQRLMIILCRVCWPQGEEQSDGRAGAHTCDRGLDNVHGLPLVDQLLSVGAQLAVKCREYLMGLHQRHFDSLFLIWKQAMEVLQMWECLRTGQRDFLFG